MFTRNHHVCTQREVTLFLLVMIEHSKPPSPATAAAVKAHGGCSIDRHSPTITPPILLCVWLFIIQIICTCGLARVGWFYIIVSLLDYSMLISGGFLVLLLFCLGNAGNYHIFIISSLSYSLFVVNVYSYSKKCAIPFKVLQFVTTLSLIYYSTK